MFLCFLIVAKIVQTEHIETCFDLPRCSLSYAKIVQKTETSVICYHYHIKKVGPTGPTSIESYKKYTHHALYVVLQKHFIFHEVFYLFMYELHYRSLILQLFDSYKRWIQMRKDGGSTSTCPPVPTYIMSVQVPRTKIINITCQHFSIIILCRQR